MLSNINKKDKRVIKTHESLNRAMFNLLKNRNFSKITVSDICAEAIISRANFYAHFTDKYDFLKYWLISLKVCIKQDDDYEKIEKVINRFIHDNKPIIKNLLDDADKYTLEALFEALSIMLNLTKKNGDGGKNPKYIIYSNFIIGGMIQYLLWQVKNNFPPEITPINMFLYELMNKFEEWQSE